MNGRLFFENVNEALDHTIKALGGYKDVGSRLRGDKDPIAASQWLRDCLNEDKREKLDPAQIVQLVKLGREQGVHAYMEFMAAELGYGPPVPLTPEVRQAQQNEAVIRAGRKIADALGELAASGVDVNAFLSRTAGGR